jgi:hypothetical protein
MSFVVGAPTRSQVAPLSPVRATEPDAPGANTVLCDVSRRRVKFPPMPAEICE